MADMRIIDLADDILLMITPLVAERLRELRRLYIIETEFRKARYMGRWHLALELAKAENDPRDWMRASARDIKQWALCCPSNKVIEQVLCLMQRRRLMKQLEDIKKDCINRYDI